MSKVYYIAGPMSGIPQFNFPLFDEWTARLRAQGLTVISPAELDDATVREEALASPDGQAGHSVVLAGETWADFLARDVKLIADGVTDIVLLEGWHGSRGARLEAFVGLLCGHEFHYARSYAPELIPAPEWAVAIQITRQWVEHA